MKLKDMKRIPLSKVRELSNGTKVYVEMVGSGWDEKQKGIEGWGVKQDNGLYYDTKGKENKIKLPYDFKFNKNNRDILFYTAEYGCDHCLRNKAILWEDDETNMFISSKGILSTKIEGKLNKKKIDHCLNCGRRFE